MTAFAGHYNTYGTEKVEFLTQIENTADASTSACDENNERPCTLQYSLRYTPLIHDIIPSNVYLDQNMTFMINP